MDYKREAKGLKDWMDNVPPMDIDGILEHLEDINCLNKDGLELRRYFWSIYIHKK